MQPKISFGQLCMVDYGVAFIFLFTIFLSIFSILYLFIFREGERKGEKHLSVACLRRPNQGQTNGNPGMCPLSLQYDTQPTK